MYNVLYKYISTIYVLYSVHIYHIGFYKIVNILSENNSG
jgi:hypothetical protein